MNDRLVLFVQIECFLFGLIECVARYPNQCDLFGWRRREKRKSKKLWMRSTEGEYLQWRADEEILETLASYFLRWVLMDANLIALVQRESFIGGRINGRNESYLHKNRINQSINRCNWHHEFIFTCKWWRPFAGAALINDCSVCSAFLHGLFAGDGTSAAFGELLTAFFCCFSNLRWARRNFAFNFNGFVGSGPTIAGFFSHSLLLVDSTATIVGGASVRLVEAIAESISPIFSSNRGWHRVLSLDSLSPSAPKSSATLLGCSLSQCGSLFVDTGRMPFNRNAFILFSIFLWDFVKRNVCASHLKDIGEQRTIFNRSNLS